MKTLSKIAAEHFDNLSSQLIPFQKEIDSLENSVEQKRQRLKIIERSRERARNFKPKIDDEYQCPNCWINGALHQKLKPIPSNTNDDYFSCKACDFEYVFAP